MRRSVASERKFFFTLWARSVDFLAYNSRLVGKFSKSGAYRERGQFTIL